MKKIIQDYPPIYNLKAVFMAVLIFCACQSAYAGDYYVSNAWVSNNTGYFTLVSYDCNQSTTIQCVEAHAPLPPVGHYYYNDGNYFYPNNNYYQTGYGSPVQCCSPTIRFENNGCRSVEIYWNNNGHPEYYKTLHPGEQYDQPSYQYNEWLIYTSGGDYLGSYTAQCYDDHVNIDSGGSAHVDAGNDKSICKGESVQLCATGADHYEWSNGHTGTCITVSPNHDKTYSVKGTTGGCSDTDHVSVHVNTAKWDNVEKGHDATCGNCDGSIIINSDYNETGKFKVKYKYNGENVTLGPYYKGSNITIDHLCPGTYSNIRIIGVDTGCEDTWSHDITIGEEDCCPNDFSGGTIVIPGAGSGAVDATETNICVDSTPDPFNVTVAGASSTNFAWVITDADLNILALPAGPPFDFNGAGEGVYLVWYLAYETVEGAEVGKNAENLTGCFSLSNPIIVNKILCCDEEGGIISIAGSSGSDSLSICVDGTPDPFNITVVGASATSFAWVITDTDLNILALPAGPPFDFDGAGEGVYLVWYLAYSSIEGAEVGKNAADLTGCFDLSNPIIVNKILCCDEEGGIISIAGSSGSDSLSICVDGTPNPLNVTVVGASATSFAWVITDTDLNILALPAGPPFDFDDAGEGVYLVWYLAYSSIEGAEVGKNAADLTGCFDLSNPITVIRTCCDSSGIPVACGDNCDEEGGMISIPPVGGSGSGVDSIAICVDGTPDPFNVTVMGASGTSFAWVITDADLNILALPAGPPFDLDGTGEGVCLVWYLAYETIGGATVGANAADLTGCFDLSNPIKVTKTCCDDAGTPTTCEAECENYTLDFNDPHTDWHKNSKSGSYDVGSQTFDVHIKDNNHILRGTDESDAGITVGIDPYNRHDEVVISYKLSEIASKVVFDIVDLDYKTSGSKQQEKVCVYGLLGNDDTKILPTIESLDGSVAIDGNCATAMTNSAYGHDESVLVTFNECIDQIIIVYGSGPDAPYNPTYSKINIGEEYGISTDVCPGECTPAPSCEDYTLDFDEQGVRWHDDAISDNYDLGGQNVSINIEDNDHILNNTNEDASGLQVGIEPHDRHDELVITYELSEVSEYVVFDIVDLDYKTGGSKQQEKVCVYGLLGNDDTKILPTIESLDGSVAIDGNCATATTNSAYGHDESVLVTFNECIDQVVIVYGSSPDAPHDPSYSKITIGEDYGFTTQVCPDPCSGDGSGSPREDLYVADVSIFPNPANNASLITLSIESDIQGRADVVVMDALGRAISNSPIELTGSITQHKIDASEFSSGVYFVTLLTQEGKSKPQQLVILSK